MARISSDTAEVKVEAIDSTKAGLDSVRANIQNLERSVLSLQKMIMQATGAVLAMKGAWNLADSAAGFMEQEAALNRLAAAYGSSSKIMVDSIKQAADGTISSLDAVNIATQGLAKGLTPDQISNLTKVAKAYGDITNQSTAQALDEIATAAETGRSRMLMQAGILVDLNKAWDEYAKSTGRTVDQLTRAEKQQVSVNAIMKASNDVMTRTASTGMTAADAMDKFKAALSDIGIVIGKVVITITTGIFAITQGVSQMVNEMIARVLFGLASILTAVDNFVQKLPIDQAIKDMTHSAAAGVLEIDKYFADSAALAADNYKQSAEMIKGIWSDLGTLPQTTPIVPDEMGEANKIVAAQKVKDDALLRSMQLRDQYSKKVYDSFVQEYQATQNIGAAITASTRKVVADVIKAKGEEYAIKAGGELWEGFGSLARYDFVSASNHFVSAAGLAAIAGAAGIASTAVAGGGGGAAPGGATPSGGGFNNSSLQPTQTQERETSYTVTIDATGAHMFTTAGVDMIFKEINNAIKTKGQRFEGVRMIT